MEEEKNWLTEDDDEAEPAEGGETAAEETAETETDEDAAGGKQTDGDDEDDEDDEGGAQTGADKKGGEPAQTAEKPKKAETGADKAQKPAAAEKTGGTDKDGAEGGKPGAQPEDGDDLIYDGKTLHKSREELRVLAQKGLNYEREAQRAYAKGQAESPASAMLNRLAEANGMTAEQLTAYINDQLETRELQPMLDAGMPEAEARELMRLRRAERENAERTRAQQETQQRAENERQSWVDFVQAYPAEAEEYAKKGVPDDFSAALERGMSPTAAQVMLENKLLKKQLGELQTAQTVAAKAAEAAKKAPPAVGKFGGKEEADEFSRIFDSD